MRVFYIILFLLMQLNVFSQKWISKIDDEDYKNRLIVGLQVGDIVPDIEFGAMINNKTGKERLSDFRGKFVIFDFWNTWCKPCIEAMPKMEKLQKEFGDKLQIFLVNPIQTSEQINNATWIKYPDLPMIVKDSLGKIDKFTKFFPARSTAHQVWIGADGKIKLRGSAKNNTSEKIRSALDGDSIFILRDNATAPRFDPKVPYYQILADFADTKLAFGSSFTRFNNEYEPETSGISEGIVDSVTKTKRYTYVNVHALTLYSIALKNILMPLKSSIIFGPYVKSKLGRYGYHTFILPTDTLLYTSEFLNKVENDKQYTNSKFCYEQIVPYDLDEETRLKNMLDDVNKFYESMYSATGSIEKREINYYALIKISNGKSLEIGKSEFKKEELIINGIKYDKYHNVDIGIIRDFIEETPSLVALFSKNYTENKPYLLFNETGISNAEMINIILPKSNNVNELQDLIKVLKMNGLDIVEKEKVIDFFRLSDRSSR